MSKIKVFFDTDIGDDIDDALALIMLLNIKKCDIVGVSTVYANTMLRARLSKKILSLYNINDIPVYAGRRKPWVNEVDVNRTFVQYTEELDNDKYAPNNDATIDEGEAAIDAMIKAARIYQSDLTILAIGPFTNIASAIKKDFEAFKNVKIVLMGGCFYEQFIEYNVVCDPEAADYVLNSGLDIEVIGADVTWQVQLNDEETSKILNMYSDSIKGYAAELVRMWKKNCWFNPVLHDPLAAYYVIDNTICKLEPVWTGVELQGSLTRGLTPNRDQFYKYLEQKVDEPRILCAKSVDVERFIKEFMKYMF